MWAEISARAEIHHVITTQQFTLLFNMVENIQMLYSKSILKILSRFITYREKVRMTRACQ